ncbi:YtxH domain-containing protein [Mucilaginibacter daejeonensis]|uniref:YtxH domain-containing protein n=1 Tax=Mucilaginibacter daejeonensis TaxID=398049 RepID=UPI001D170908|nr:YtxH domain-containing protein [Mucilaginibacter daejeonensis]UEG54045.1 YtxH domain-containing protein [Mucilaginibacter daejeonensis]
MGLLKWAIVGAAAAYGIKYITEKRQEDGKSIIDDWNEKAPDLMEKAKQYTDEAVQRVTSRMRENYH